LIITEHDDPSPYIIIDEFLSKDALNKIKTEIKAISMFSTEGQVNHNNQISVNKDIKRNHNVWVDELFINRRDESNILKEIKNNIWSPITYDFYRNTKASIFRLYELTNTDTTLLSIYKNGDFYKEHTDIAGYDRNSNEKMFLTAVLMLKMNGDFKGGELVLQEKVIPYKDNRLIIFESHRSHSVNKTITDDNPDNWRYTLQYFAKIK